MNVHESMMDELADETKFKQLSAEQVEAWIMVSPTHPTYRSHMVIFTRAHSCFRVCGLWELLEMRKVEQHLIH